MSHLKTFLSAISQPLLCVWKNLLSVETCFPSVEKCFPNIYNRLFGIKKEMQCKLETSLGSHPQRYCVIVFSIPVYSLMNKRACKSQYLRNTDPLFVDQTKREGVCYNKCRVWWAWRAALGKTTLHDGYWEPPWLMRQSKPQYLQKHKRH